jgi:hypothetical protein
LYDLVVLSNIVSIILVQHGQGDHDEVKNTCEALDSALLYRFFIEKLKKLKGRKVFYSLGSGMWAEVLQHSIKVPRRWTLK